MKHPKDGRVMNPQVHPAGQLRRPPVPDRSAPARWRYAEWLTSKDNPFFAKSIANRVWSYFFGRGIIDPVDDIRASNPPSNPALLDALTKDFIDHNFDLRHLMRTIVNSRAYQASIATNEWNADDADNFSHAMPRRLSAEELMDAVALATGVRPVFPEAPPDTRAEQLPDPHVGKDGFLDLFGRPVARIGVRVRAAQRLSLPQALNLVNGKTISDAVADPNGRVAKAILSGQADRDVVEELYLASLSRPPHAAELDKRREVSASGRRTRRAGAGSAVGAAQQQGVSVQLLTGRTKIIMLNIPGRQCHTCEGPTRRELLRAGSIGLLGSEPRELSSPGRRPRRRADEVRRRARLRQREIVIMIFLQGGPSHIDIWDPKPDAPANIRGEFKPIKTKIPGTHIGEHMPMMAQGAGQGHAHPLDELHAQRPVQSHGGDLPDADRLSAGQGVALGPAGAAQRRGFSHRGQPHLAS